MKNLRNILTTVLIIVFIALGVSIFNNALRPSDTDGAYAQIETFHSLPKDTLEVIVYGSSHAYRGLDPRELYSMYGIGSYNYAYNWQHLNTTEAFIKDSLISQKPKLILIETYFINELLYDCDLNPQIYYCRYLHNREAKINFLKECFGSNLDRWVSYYCPLYAFHDNWVDISLNSFLPPKNNIYYIKTMGFSRSDNVYNDFLIPDQKSIPQDELSDSAIKKLDDIISICEEYGIKILFYTAPYRGVNVYHDAINEYCIKKGCSYIDLFDYLDEAGIKEDSDFSDSDHLNTSGATKVADFLGKYMIDNYDLTDMRKIKDNIWSKYIEY